MQRTAEFHDEIADALLPQADAVFDNAAALDTTVDMLDPQPTLVERLIRALLLPCQLLSARFPGQHEDLYLGQCEGQKTQILQQSTPGQEWVGGSLRDARIMGPTAVGVAQKEDDEQSMDEQDIFDGVISFLPVITRFLFSSVLGADNPPFRPIMGKRGRLM
jgi:hypothetical protein